MEMASISLLAFWPLPIPGGIVITASLKEQVRGQLAYQTADLGFLTVKNVAAEGIEDLKIAPPSRLL